MATTAARAAALQQTLAHNAALTDELCGILGKFDARMARLEEAILPVQERAQALSLAAENVAKAQEATQATLREFDVPRALEARLTAPVGADVDAYLADVDSLLDAAAFFAEHTDAMRAAEPALRGARELLGRAMGRCDEKFRALLAAHARSDAAPWAAEVEPPAEVPPPLAGEALPVLRALVGHMDAVGYDAHEAALVEARSRSVDALLRQKGLDKLSAPGDVARLPPEALGERALLWARVLRWAAALWCAERPLAAQLLAEGAAADAVAAVAARAGGALCAFGEALVAGRKCADRLFAFVDVHTAAAAALPQLAAPLDGPAGAKLLGRLAALRDAAGAAAAAAFADWEAFVGREDRRPAGPDGTVHPLTAATTAALRRLFELPQLFDLLAQTGEAPPRPRHRRGGSAGAPPPSATDAALAAVGDTALRVLMALHGALDARARGCKAPGLADLFLLNNLHFVVRAVRQTPLLLDSLGEEWAQRQEALLEHHAAAVVAATWGAAATELGDVAGLSPAALSVKDRERVKDKFRVFNDTLDAAAQTLPHWSVPDAPLRRQLRERLRADVLAPYEALFDAFADSPFTKFKEKYVKHAPDDAARVFEAFFEGLRE